jgi:hypothetical protein
MKTAIEKLDDVTAIATSGGNYDSNAYMHGMANGLLLAQAIMKDQEVKYLDAPAKWLEDRPPVSYETTTGHS